MGGVILVILIIIIILQLSDLNLFPNDKHSK